MREIFFFYYLFLYYYIDFGFRNLFPGIPFKQTRISENRTGFELTSETPIPIQNLYLFLLSGTDLFIDGVIYQMSQLKIKSKLLVMFFSVTVPSIGVIGGLGYLTGKNSLSKTIFNQLTSIRSTKAYQVESYFKNMRSQVDTLSESTMMITASKDFIIAYNELKSADLSPSIRLKVDEYYHTTFKNQYRSSTSIELEPSNLIPQNNAAYRLQNEYILNNPHSTGEKDKLSRSNSGSSYDRLHGIYHEKLRNYIQSFGFYDLFIISPDGDIVYTVYKEVDLGSNLFSGSLKNSKFSKLISDVINTKELKHAKISDFESYTPSFEAPAAFIADVIMENGNTVGVLALQLPVDEINRVMTGGQNWKTDGLGESGETYLVGADFKMRSNSRFLIESPDEYFQMLKNIGTDDSVISRIKNYKTSILEQSVKTEASLDAFKGNKNTKIISDYRGVSVLSSYSGLDIEDLNWIILSEIDLDEAYEPIYTFTKILIIFSLILFVFVIFVVIKYTKIFTEPIDILMQGTGELASGNYSKRVSITSQDEFGNLAIMFNNMAGRIEEKNAEILQKNIENEKLLLNILPSEIATRLRSGEQTIADSFPNVAVLFADLVGFTKLSETNGAEKIVQLLNELFSNFDILARKHGVEKIKTIGDCYMAVSGLPVPRADYAEAMADLALEMIESLKELNQKSDTLMELRIGINSGPVVAGVIGTSKFIYDLWGDTVNLASRMESHGLPNEVHTTEDVFLILGEKYEFEPRGDIDIKGKGVMKTFFLKGKAKK